MDEDITAVAAAVAAYLLAHPQASDTATGIARWWLPADMGWHVASMDKVKAAMAWMTASGLVEELTAADGRTRYRRSAPDDALQRLIARQAGISGANGR